jgi:hypothetical protein
VSDGLIPEQAWEKIRGFVQAQKTDSITLDVKERAVLSWKITEYGRVAKESERPYSTR